MMWPWSRFQKDAAFIETLQGHLQAAQGFLAEHTTARAVEAVERRTLERDLERAYAELHLVQQDFKALVNVTARPVTKTQPIDFSRDPFAEDPKLPDTWLSDDSVLPDIEAIEEQISGEGEDGERRGPGSRQGA